MPTIIELADTFRSALLRRETQATLAIVRSYQPIVLLLEEKLDRVNRRLERLRDTGAHISPSVVFEQERFGALLDQTRDEITRWGTSASSEVTSAQQAGIDRVPEDTLKLTTAALGPAPEEAITAVQGAWTALPTHAMEAFVGRASDGTPLRDLFHTIAPGVADDLQKTVLGGITRGANPRETAREIRDNFGTGLNRALLISRTETITAYRSGTRDTYRENNAVLEGWVWCAELDERTCAACWAMNGTYHSTDAELDGHPMCRCSMVPATQSWDVLGFDNIPDSRPEIELGADAFDRQPESIQRAVLGNKGYDYYVANGRRLTDWLGRKDDARWGTMRYTRSVRQIERGGGGFQTGAEVQGTFSPGRAPAGPTVAERATGNNLVEAEEE